MAVILVGCGSAYYHQAPSNTTLLWDRLPMTVAFMALFTLLLEERVLARRVPGLLWLLVATGAASVLYWAWSESIGKGDLRAYILVQYLPILLMPLILLMFRSRALRDGMLWSAFACYLLAKLLELGDVRIWNLTGGMAGHALKHLAAAAAVLCIIASVPATRHRRDLR